MGYKLGNPGWKHHVRFTSLQATNVDVIKAHCFGPELYFFGSASVLSLDNKMLKSPWATCPGQNMKNYLVNTVEHLQLKISTWSQFINWSMNWSLSYCPQVGVLGHLFGGPKHVSLILRIIDGKYNYDLGFDTTLNSLVDMVWISISCSCTCCHRIYWDDNRLHSLCLTWLTIQDHLTVLF